MDFKFRTLYSIKPKDYNELFSLPSNRKKKVETFRKFTNENNNKNSDSNIYLSYNKFQDRNYNSTFHFYKTDTIPFPNFPKKKKITKFNINQLFTPKIKKKENNFSIKYIELLKDINNERKLKNYYILKGNNKLKYLKDCGLKLIKIIFENDIETITRSVASLNNIKQKIYSNINPKSLVKSIYNENKKNSSTQTSNIFFKEILNDIYRQIEICNKKNNQVDIVFVKNLLIIELNKIEKDFKNLNKYIKQLLEDNVIEETEEFIKKHRKHMKNGEKQNDSSSSSSYKEKKYNIFGKEYLQMLFRNKIKGYVKNFKNYNPNTVVSSIGTNVNNFRPIITNYKVKQKNYFTKNSNQQIKNDLNISNEKEKDFEMKDIQQNIHQSNNNEFINDNIHSQSQRSNTYNNIIQEKKIIQDKIGNINTEMDNNVIYSSGYFNKINNPLANNSLLNNNINNDILDIKETMTIPVNIKNINNTEKPISPINKINYIKKIANNAIIANKNENIKINLNINSSSQNDYNYQKRISKIETKKEKEEKDDGFNFSMAKIFEQLIKNDSVKSKTIKKTTGVKSDAKAFERKKTQGKIEFKNNFDKRKSVMEENIIKEYTNKLLNTPGVTLTKAEILEEVKNIKKELLKPVKSTASSKKKGKITKVGLNELKEKLVLINHVDQMNMNKEQKEEFLNHIFEYKLLLNKTNKTEEELEKEKEIRYKLRSIIEKYLYELQKRGLINTKSIYSKKKSYIKNNLAFLKDLKLNIFEDEEKKEEDKDQPKNEKGKEVKQEKILVEVNENNNNNTNTLDELLKNTKIEKKKEKKLIYDNSYMFSKHQKNIEIRDEVLQIMNTNYALVNDNNNSNTSTINDKSSYYSSTKKKIKQKKKFKKKNVNVSRRISIFDINESIEKKKLIDKKNEEERIRREEEAKRKKKEIEDIQKREEIFDKKLYDFFDKIKKMKNHGGNYDDELEKLIDEQANNLDDAKEMRINSFIHKLRLNREKEKFFSKFQNKKLGYSSPLIFTMNNFYPKTKTLFRNNNINNEDNLYRTEYFNKNDK